ncbi:MAG: S-methyl-5-thioribose-1-phosphate isomerase [Deltaproteobacteria bacterium]|nr:S-methyl-5-thioribose-1-phosphate isomerase [Deltaproteobacteria bacterium]
MKVDGRWRRTIERDGDAVIVLDQARLPFEVAWLRLTTLDDVARAIRDMHVRGAPLIGAAAAWGVALALREGHALDHACRVLAATRPTAVNLKWALDRMRTARDAEAEAQRICDEDVAGCKAIGQAGLPLLRDGCNVLTHCNAGWLATVDWGTALAPIYAAHEAGMRVHVWVDETRPRNQGLLTAWELAQHGVPHTVIADNAGGHLMQHGRVDLCIVGTDRVLRTGDVANKIGTYLKALAARDNNVPFYVAMPASSFDASSDTVEIEERSADEVRAIAGIVDGKPARVRITEATVANPAFDVTPARLVTGYITERGVVAKV